MYEQTLNCMYISLFNKTKIRKPLTLVVKIIHMMLYTVKKHDLSQTIFTIFETFSLKRDLILHHFKLSDT